MENSQNLISQNQADEVKNQSNTGNSFSISGSTISIQGSSNLGNNQFGNNAKFITNNSPKPTEQSEIDEKDKQTTENNSPAPTSSEGCCLLTVQKLGCGKVMSFWCFNLEPSAEGISLKCSCCCWNNSEKTSAQQTNNNQSTQQEVVNQQPQSVSQMENTNQQETLQEQQQAQIQIPPK